jgi:hypothetical protein
MRLQVAVETVEHLVDLGADRVQPFDHVPVVGVRRVERHAAGEVAGLSSRQNLGDALGVEALLRGFLPEDDEAFARAVIVDQRRHREVEAAPVEADLGVEHVGQRLELVADGARLLVEDVDVMAEQETLADLDAALVPVFLRLREAVFETGHDEGDLEVVVREHVLRLRPLDRGLEALGLLQPVEHGLLNAGLETQVQP